MPLYTVRIRLASQESLNRGASFFEMSLHYLWPNDDAAADDLPALAEWMTHQPMARRWLVARGDQDVHEMTIYRRDPTQARVWIRIVGGLFSLGEWQDADFDLDIPGVSAGMHFVGGERPLWPDQRGAVLVRCRSDVPQISRRIYVGPLSPLPFIVRATVSALGVDLLELPGASIIDNTFSGANGGDSALVPGDDSLDRWRPQIAHDARDFIRDMLSVPDGGLPVIPSWEHGATVPVTRIDASYVRAVIKTRGVRGEMSSYVG